MATLQKSPSSNPGTMIESLLIEPNLGFWVLTKLDSELTPYHSPSVRQAHTQMSEGPVVPFSLLSKTTLKDLLQTEASPVLARNHKR